MSEAKPDLEALARARNEARRKVVDWMNAEGAAGNFRTNSQAPAWAEYQAAEDALAAAIAAVQ